MNYENFLSRPRTELLKSIALSLVRVVLFSFLVLWVVDWVWLTFVFPTLILSHNTQNRNVNASGRGAFGKNKINYSSNKVLATDDV